MTTCDLLYVKAHLLSVPAVFTVLYISTCNNNNNNNNLEGKISSIARDVQAIIDYDPSPLNTVGLRLSKEAIRVVTDRVETVICQPHTYICGALIDASGLHGLACRMSSPCHTHHSQFNDIIWRAVKKTQIPAIHIQSTATSAGATARSQPPTR